MTTFFLLFVVLLLLGFDLVDATGCPHCGNFNSCTWASNNKCPADTVVAANAVVMAAGTGLITLAGIIRPRFLKLFSQVAFDTIIALVNRSEQGTPFQISKTTTATALLTAVSNSLITLDIAVLKLCELIEAESDPSAAPSYTALGVCEDCVRDPSSDHWTRYLHRPHGLGHSHLHDGQGV